jgi:hypothetical protein
MFLGAIADGALAALRLPNLVALLLVFVAACWTTGGPLRRASGIAVGVVALAAAWFLPERYPLVRGVSALAAFVGGMRILDLRTGSWTLGGRLAHVVSFVDTRRLVRASPRIELRVVGAGLAWVLAALAGYAWLEAEPPAAPALAYLVRWSAALVVVYSGVEGGYALIRALYAVLGFQTGALHATPLLSRSVDELWSERWARPVSLWLRETLFRPLARRRRPVLGGVLAFAVSGAFHAYGVWVALGWAPGLSMAECMFAFFLMQALLVAGERALGTRRWPDWRRRAWAATVMLASAPLFLEPVARVLGQGAALPR